MASTKKISWEELAKHNTTEDCWVAINGKVYDLTSFLEEHPAGPKIITRQAGKDGTDAFDPYHAPDIIETLGKEHLQVGVIEGDAPESAKDSATVEAVVNKGEKPPLEACLNTWDFQAIAKSQMSAQGWAYYSSGSDDEVTLRENKAAFGRIWLVPRVLVNVSSIDTSSKMLGYDITLPLYITATALGKLAHKEGELALCRAAHAKNIIQMCPTLSSYTLDQMIAARQGSQVQCFQLYVNGDREVTKKIVKRAEDGGMKALFITVDAPALGRREKDMRHKMTEQGSDVQKSDDGKGKVDRSKGTARAISQFIDPGLNWDDLAWFKSITKMPIFLKGVQCAEDAVKAVDAGMAGIVVSNHGGRQIDYCRSGIEVLEEVMVALKKHKAPASFEVYVDGGVRRGVDIFKAVALGATACGIGRPSLYGLAAYGQAGVERVIDIFKEELEMCMKLMGTPTIADIAPQHVITRNLADHINGVPGDELQRQSYIPLKPLEASL